MPSEHRHSGTLYVVATPLGNLDDITLRAIKTLANSEAIACEDTRRASILLRHLGITGKQLVSYHDFNEPAAISRIARLLEEGLDVSLITDAGTPVISDPGYLMVRTLREKGFTVLPIPGPSALTAALSVCPLPVSSFLFAGFLPHKKGRQSRLEYLSSLGMTFVLYESPYRIKKLLDELTAHLPDAEIFIAREMTKIHEEYLAGTVENIKEQLPDEKIRGEFVVVVHPANSKNTGKNTLPNKYEQHADHH
ncbi:MAG: 16S rRNA (cytidine(1402)-2'-O)-methyltransferase [Chlorobium limicola]|uniref:Ribosomal RNA small subunit methyltransferase I n=1 Tax=Chlorobium limicola (strain DSM 245 / NBRC 103803 / 6330) TaxID=290315 RepID=B3EH08_CHLL2|nr:16S rRNA (cytidine(1402)-2'-O)-methyltransferase [Chlorobium limicola]ACD89688.1 Uroporphyrin-III C/tetrapyrrole (Corrin/Porphyrin) methyltransferase [Chlorobium limicola DSM 245]NTV20600.1 16S rRNA (cytidine(1402)-2'-O)-methyltransferase [Chlorobium limicola]